MTRTINFKDLRKELFLLAFPMVITQLITVSSGFITIVLLSDLGTETLAASALFSSIRISALVISSSLLFALSVITSRFYSMKEYSKVGNFIQQGWMLALIISLPIYLFFWNIYPLLIHFHQVPELAKIAKDFFHANIWNITPFLLSVCNQQLLYSVRKQKIDLVANIIGICVLISSAYLFIFGYGDFPKLGVAGLGYALSLQSWCYFVFTTLIILCSDFFKKFNLFSLKFKQILNDFIYLIKIGWPICVQIGGEMLSFAVSAIFIGWLGPKSLAASQIVSQYVFLAIIPLFALSQASGILVSQMVGEAKFDKIKLIGQISIVFSLAITSIIALVFFIFPKKLASVYLNQPDTVILNLVTLLFYIFAFHLIIDGIRNVLTGALRGLFDTKFPMIVGLGCIWIIGVPLGYFLAFKLALGVIGMAMGAVIGVFVGMIALVYRWHALTIKLTKPN